MKTVTVTWNLPESTVKKIRATTRRRQKALGKASPYGLQPKIVNEALLVGLKKVKD